MDRFRPSSRGSQRKLDFKTAFFLIVIVTTGPVGAVYMRRGMEQAKLLDPLSFHMIYQIAGMILTNGDVALGIFARIVSALAFMLMLSWADYSFVNPVTSVGYVVTVLLGWLMLGEVVPAGRWIGTLLICLGVFFIGRTPARTTPLEEGEEAESL